MKNSFYDQEWNWALLNKWSFAVLHWRSPAVLIISEVVPFCQWYRVHKQQSFVLHKIKRWSLVSAFLPYFFVNRAVKPKNLISDVNPFISKSEPVKDFWVIFFSYCFQKQNSVQRWSIWSEPIIFYKKEKLRATLSKISISNSQEDVENFGSIFFSSLFQPPTRLGCRWGQVGKC